MASSRHSVPTGALHTLATYGLHAAAMAAAVSAPLVELNSQWKLTLIKQNSLSEEKFVKGGQSHTAKVVVKKSPFLVQLGLVPVDPDRPPTGPPIDLRQFIYEARLVYDADEEKEVDYVKVKPLEFKSTISESGTLVNGEARINVLTSQLEDMLFRIKIRALDIKTRREVSPTLMAFSFPIKVVSKPDQVRKKKRAKEEDAKKKAPAAAAAAAAAPPPPPAVPDELIQALQRIEKHQQAQQDLLNKITEQLTGRNPCISLEPSSLSGVEATGLDLSDLAAATSIEEPRSESSEDEDEIQEERETKKIKWEHPPASKSPLLPPHSAAPTGAQEHVHHNTGEANNAQTSCCGAEPTADKDKILDFEAAFSTLMGSCESVTPEQRTERMRNVIKQMRLSREAVSEIHDLFWAEGLQRALGDESGGGGDGIHIESISRGPSLKGTEQACTCEDCPHKKELSRIENFYREVFSLY